MQMSFKELLEQRSLETGEIVCSYLPGEEGFQKLLIEAMNYSVKAGGKRLRPLMLRSAFLIFGGQSEECAGYAGPFMAAMEMIHTHSLVHDDLPAMDNDLYRRGRKTTWAVYGDGMAVLAGDGLLNYAYETALLALDKHPGDINIGKALLILSQKTGIYGMMGGQSVDVMMEGKPLNDDVLSFIYALKTGALIEASLMIGAQLAGADKEIIDSLERIGREIGLAFQIRDDILDVTGDEKTLGKPIGSDAKNEKTTYVTVHGLEAAQKKTRQLTDEALAEFDNIAGKAAGREEAAFLRELLLSLAGRSS